MAGLRSMLWAGELGLDAMALHAMAFRNWNPACPNIFGDLLGGVPVSEAADLGGMFWNFDDPASDGYGPGWVLEPTSKTTTFFDFHPFSDDNAGNIDVVVYLAATGDVVTYDLGIGPPLQGDPRPSPLHHAARVHRIGNAQTTADDPRVRSWFWEATEIGGRFSTTYWAVRMWLSGLLNWSILPLRVLLFDDSWDPSRAEVKYAVTIADIPGGAYLGVSDLVPYAPRNIYNSSAIYGDLTPSPDFTAVPIHGVPPDRNVGGAVIYHDAGGEILRICKFPLYGDVQTAGTDPVWVSPVTVGFH